jgi:hypothetical protein
VEHIGSAKFREKRLPVETAMCDYFQGFGNFCRAEIGRASDVDPILCKLHATGQ